jgi:prolipoprotein diacylglyceryl transferase
MPLASIPSPASSGLTVGPFEVHVYGLMYVIALVVGIAIVVRRWEATGGSRQLVYDVALWAFPAGLLGGRLYFDLTSSGEVPPHWWGPFAVWDGGMGIWGGIALGAAVGLWRLRRAGVAPGPFMDAAAPALLVGQAIGRVGNYFNQELFGGPTSLPWGLQISPAHRPAGYAAFATFQPTFLYELTWNLGLAAFLVWLGHHRKIRPPGLFALYVSGYSAFRIFEESLRVDPAHHFLGFRLNFFVACLLAVGGAAWFVAIQRGWSLKGRRGRGAGLLALAGATAALAGCGQGGSPRSDAVDGARPACAQSGQYRDTCATAAGVRRSSGATSPASPSPPSVAIVATVDSALAARS